MSSAGYRPAYVDYFAASRDSDSVVHWFRGLNSGGRNRLTVNDKYMIKAVEMRRCIACELCLAIKPANVCRLLCTLSKHFSHGHKTKRSENNNEETKPNKNIKVDDAAISELGFRCSHNTEMDR